MTFLDKRKRRSGFLNRGHVPNLAKNLVKQFSWVSLRKVREPVENVERVLSKKLRDVRYSFGFYRSIMGEWLVVPGVEEVLENRFSHDSYLRGARAGARRRRRRFNDILVYFDGNDIANLADVSDAPLWECEMAEMPLTDDGF